jgi:cysteine desulfurase family protein
MIYFDNAATTLVKPKSVAKAMASAVDRLGSPGRGGHEAAMMAAEEAYACRSLAARMFGVPDPGSVVFCMNATHALNLAIKSIALPGDRVVITGYEHNSVLRPLTAIHARISVAAAPPFRPEKTLEAFKRELKEDTKLAVVNHVSNVFGAVQPLNEIAQLCHVRGVPLVVDASQSAGVLPLDLTKLGAAFIAMPGHKSLYGPQGTGLLLCGGDARPLLEGGSGSDSRNRRMPERLPDRLEAGTLNMPGIAGLHQGLRYVQRQKPSVILMKERALLNLAVTRLRTIPDVEIYAADSPELQTGVLSFHVAGEDPELTAERLSARGIAVRAGLHCAPLAHDTAGSTGTVRLSFSVFNQPWEVERFAAVLKENLR